MEHPLAGIRVLDFGRFIAGPFCAAMLADMGADVVRIEPPSGADDRHMMPLDGFEDVGGSLYLHCNRGKRSLTLDLRSPEARPVMEALVRRSDVVVANMPPAALRALGLDYAALAAIKPDIVVATSTAFGLEGPLAGRPGFDGIGQAMSGAMYLSGDETGPRRTAVNVVDYGTAMAAAYGVMTALFRRERTGQGGQVSTSLLDTALNYAASPLLEHASGTRSRTPVGNRSLVAGPSDVFACTDGHVLVQVVGQSAFGRLAGLIGRKDLIDDPAFASDAERGANGAALSAIMAEWTRNQSCDAVVSALAGARVPACRVLDLGGVLDPAQGLCAHLLPNRTLADGHALPFPRPPALLSGAGGSSAPAPRLGADTDSVLAEAGLSTRHITALRDSGVI